jgi:hypothetical protein
MVNFIHGKAALQNGGDPRQALQTLVNLLEGTRAVLVKEIR